MDTARSDYHAFKSMRQTLSVTTVPTEDALINRYLRTLAASTAPTPALNEGTH